MVHFRSPLTKSSGNTKTPNRLQKAPSNQPEQSAGQGGSLAQAQMDGAHHSRSKPHTATSPAAPHPAQPAAAAAPRTTTATTTSTDVTHSHLPTVIHERVQHTEHEIVNRPVAREIHTHDVHHTIQPVVQTEVMPTKHYVDLGAGRLVEMSAEEAAKHPHGAAWGPLGPSAPEAAGHGHAQGRVGLGGVGSTMADAHSTAGSVSTITAADLAAAAQRAQQRQGRPEPVLVDKKTYVTADGVPRTEYLWRHPPDFVGDCGPVDGPGESAPPPQASSATARARGPSGAATVAPAPVKAVVAPGQVGVAVTTRGKTAASVEPAHGLVRRGSFRDLREAMMNHGAAADDEPGRQLRRETNEQAVRMFLEK